MDQQILASCFALENNAIARQGKAHEIESDIVGGESDALVYKDIGIRQIDALRQIVGTRGCNPEREVLRSNSTARISCLGSSLHARVHPSSGDGPGLRIGQWSKGRQKKPYRQSHRILQIID